jgi:exodeoxyribonuclease VII large subunit
MSRDLFPQPGTARSGRSEVRGRSGGALRDLGGTGLRALDLWAGEEVTVSEANGLAKELIEGVVPPLWVAGEIVNFTRARSGHCYFTLRDETAQLRCVMWRDDARRLPTPPEEGMAVRALGRLTLYPARGDFQLSVSQLEGKGDGLWKLALERLRQKLEAEGLTSPARRRPLPRHPRVVGVVTSPSGAVFHDILNVIRRRAPWTRVVLAGCRVQGDGAAEDIVAAIRRIETLALVDVLIVGRGGGSAEDLWAFNQEIVARAIAAASIPVISAVGHETDVTIADLVADLRAPTPSAAAEAAVPDRTELDRGLQRDGWRLSQAIAGRLGRAQEAIEVHERQLRRAGDRLVADCRESLRTAARHLEALSPMAALARGYAVPLARGRILRRVDEYVPGMPFDLRVRDGVVPCRVEEIGPARRTLRADD